MRSEVGVKWNNVSPGKSGEAKDSNEYYEGYLSEIPEVKQAFSDGWPIILYGYSDEKIKKSCAPGKRAKKSKQARLSDKIDRTVFGNRAYRVESAAFHFKSFKVDLSNVEPSENEVLSKLKAPVIIVADQSGKVKAVFKQKCNDNALAKVMSNILAEKKINCKALNAQVKKSMDQLFATVADLYRTERKVSLIEKKVKKAIKKNKKEKQIKKIQDKLTLAKSECEKLEEKKKTILEDFQKFLKKSGTPERKKNDEVAQND